MAQTGLRNVITTAGDARVKLQLVQNLASFVRLGLEKFGYQNSEIRISTTVNAIRSALADSLVNGSKERCPEAELRERVLTAYLDEFDTNCKLYLRQPLIPMALTHWKEETLLIEKRYGSAPVTGLSVKPSLTGALEMAWHNLRRAQQRRMAWMVLGSMFWNTAEGRSRLTADVHDFDAVAKALGQEEHHMEKHMMMFALIQGGQAADTARAWVLKTKLSDGMGVMEYLEPDGNVPGSWKTADEKSLRASLRSAN